MGIENVENLKNDDASVTTAEEATQDVNAAPPVDITPSQAQTTSPDVQITNDPGPAPEGDAPEDDGSHTDNQDDDPASDDAVDPLAEDNVIPVHTTENPSA